MENRIDRHLGLIAYLVFAAVVVVALVGYQFHNNSRFNKADRISCANRQAVIANQKVVLDILLLHLDVDVRSATSIHVQQVRDSIQLLRQAESRLMATPGCRL